MESRIQALVGANRVKSQRESAMSLRVRRWPIDGMSKKYGRKLRMLRDGRRMYELAGEIDREDIINHFNKSSGQFTPGLSEKKIATFVTGVSGRAGGPADWERHWWKSVRRHSKERLQEAEKDLCDNDLDPRKKTVLLSEQRNIESGSLLRQRGGLKKKKKKEKEEGTVVMKIKERRRLPFEKRVSRALAVLSERVQQVQEGAVGVVHSGRIAAEAVDGLRSRIARWEASGSTSVEHLREVLRLHGGESTRRRWLDDLTAETPLPDAVLEIAEGIIYGDTCVVVDETLLEKTVLQCLAQSGLEELGVGMFRLAVVCGEQCSALSEATEELYELAEGALRLQGEILAEPRRGGRGSVADASPASLASLASFMSTSTLASSSPGPSPLAFPVFAGARAVRVGVRVCAALDGLRNGELMLWASHVVVAHSAAAPAPGSG